MQKVCATIATICTAARSWQPNVLTVTDSIMLKEHARAAIIPNILKPKNRKSDHFFPCRRHSFQKYPVSSQA